VYENNAYDISCILKSHFKYGLISCYLIHVELMVYKLNWSTIVSIGNVEGWSLNETYQSIVKATYMYLSVALY
jgi:hypothetical protein